MATDEQLISQFLEMIAAERGAADNTLQAYRRDLDDFLRHLATRNQALPVVVPADISAYLRAISESGLAPASRARRLSAIRQLFKFLASEQLIAEDPAHGLAGPKKARALPKTLSVAEVDRLIETARARIEPAKGRDRVRALRLHALIEMLYATGMRVSELVSLPRTVLAGDGRVLTIKGKGGRERLVPLNQAARAALERYLNVGVRRRRGADAATKWLFASTRRGGPSDAPAPRPGTEGAGRRKRASTPSGFARTCCAMPSPAICSIAAPICARCSSCLGTPTSRRPRSTRTCWRSG